MSKIPTIAWREFKQTVFRPVFLLAILGVPLLIIGAMAVAAMMVISHEEPPLVGELVIISSDEAVAAALQHELSPDQLEEEQREQVQKQLEAAQQPGGMGAGAFGPQNMNEVPALKRGEINVTVNHNRPDDPEINLANLKEKVQTGTMLALAVIPDALLEKPATAAQNETIEDDTTGEVEADNKPADDQSAENINTFELIVPPSMDADHVSLLERNIGQAIVHVRAARAGLDPRETLALLQAPGASTRRILETGVEESETDTTRELKRMIPIVFMILLWMGVFVAGQHLLMSTIEEKSNRVMEVLLSAVSPMQLMTGKIIGHGAVGLLITGIYASLGVAGLIYFAAMHFIDPMQIVYLFVFYFMAYFMIASMFAAVGGAVTDIREANTLMTPVMLIVMIPWFLWFPIIQSPNGAFATALSWIPPMTPFVMILRTSADEAVPLWQIPATIAWGYFCVLIMIWAAAKIFRVGVLMYGKPPSFIQLVKWLRYS